MAKSEWTLNTLKLYVEDKFSASEKAVNAALAAAEKAVTKAEAASEKRADASNEIRAAMMDAQTNFATKEGLEALSKRLDAVVTLQNVGAGRSQGVGQLVTVAIAVAAVLVSGLALYLHR